VATACIGLDLGSSAVKLAELSRGRDGTCEFLAFGIEPIPADCIVDGTIMNQSAVVDAVRALYARLRLWRREVALAIAGHSVIIKKLAVASMSASELDARIPIEAERHIPFAKDDVELDFQAAQGAVAVGLALRQPGDKFS
jgi:type IV pilus assembly protein PilM